MNIYVGNLAQAVSEDTLRDLFQEFGTVTSIKLIKDRETGMPRGFAFVDMPEQQQAQQAIDSLNGHELEGQRLRINEARERDARPPRTGGSRFGSNGGSNGGGSRGGFGGGPRSGGFGGSRDRY